MSYYYNSYIFSSSELKKKVIDSQPLILLSIFIDIAFTIIYGIYYNINFYLTPLSLFGIFGSWKYRTNFLQLYQLNLIANICLRIWTISITKEIFLWSFIPFQFLILNKNWKFMWEINFLNEEDLKSIRYGGYPLYENI